MLEIATSLLPFARGFVREVGPEGEFEHRYLTLELSIRLLGLFSNPSNSKDETDAFLDDAKALCLTVLSRNDEIAPAAALLAEGVQICRRRGFVVEDDALRTLDMMLKKIGEPLSGLIRTITAPIPSAADVLSLARGLEPARYASDTGFDIRNVARAARRLLDSDRSTIDPLESAMAIELLADQALRRHSEATPTSDALHGLPNSVDEAGGFAEEYSRFGIRVVLLGLGDSGQLVRVTAQRGILGAVVREASETFSKARFMEWSKRFPYHYADVSDTDNTFYTSTEGLGVTIDASERTLFVMDASLMQLPPNILRLGDSFIGQVIAVSSAPSLAWLKSVRGTTRKTASKRFAWIPTAAKHGRNSTLAMLAERVSPTLVLHSIALDPSSQIPASLSGSDLAIIAAHGGVVRDGRFFQSIGDDDDLKVPSGDLSSALSAVELVVLFVCSGGRLDAYPFANATVGLVRDLLNRGCRTVIASPWPLDARVPSHWLPEFLKCWEAGRFVIDSNFEANKAVRKAMGDAPARCLAMTVFGDPLLTKS